MKFEISRKMLIWVGVTLGLFFIAILAGLAKSLIFLTDESPQLKVKSGFLVTVHEGRNTYAVLNIKNTGDESDKLLGVSVQPKDAARAELHDSKMNPLTSVDIPANGEVLMTGDPHIMLIDTKRDIMVGETVNLTLDFEKSRDVTLAFTVTQKDGHNHEH